MLFRGMIHPLSGICIQVNIRGGLPKRGLQGLNPR
jgi:hypothetical protein